MRVALVERELVGGECAYWACIPSKTLLRPAEARAEAARAAGVERPALRWPELAAYRDFMVRNLDDSKEVEGYRGEGVEVLRGEGTIAGPGSVQVAGQALACERIVVATGSETATPAIDGLAQAGFWTNREATTLEQLPDSVIVLGGGPVGIELGQFFARFGAHVTLVQAQERLIPREEPAVAELIAQTLRSEGVELRLGTSAESVARGDGAHHVRLSDGEEISAAELLVATGRRPRVDGIGLETVGIEPGAHGIEVDERCRAGEGVWAIGDVTGVMPFTHVGMYQGRIAAADIAGEDARASYGAIPRVVFSDPEIAAVGLTTEQAQAQGMELESARIELAEAIARPWTYERDPRGELGLLADRRRQVLVGAWAVAPLASEWIHQAALAIKAEVPLAVLRDTVAQFPTFSEAYFKCIEALAPV
ncbi:MAG: pyridine nucleotide-disulfide oxidoreductase dimerization region [Solirubrobacterales bacterium]|nr:pyridine nucleotide-disulfide oxidoreductase dimerization region [Solirubrobacterales bacterium]